MPTAVWDDSVATWDDPVELWDSGFVAPLPPPAPPIIPTVSWTIDGRSVELADPVWSASWGGYDTASGKIAEDDARRIGQGSILKAFVGTKCVWEGRLTRNPLVVRGVAEIHAAGYKVAADKQTGRLLYQSRDYSLWQDTADPPFEFADTDKIEAEVRNASLFWRIDKNEDALALNDIHSLAFWAEGTPDGISRVAGTFRGRNPGANMQLNVASFTGPSGSRTHFSGSPVSSLSGDLPPLTSTQGEDGVRLGYQAQAGFTPNEKKVLRIVNLRVNGIAAGDEMTTSEVVADIGGRLGWDTSGVQSSTLNALPFDLQDGNWSEEGLGYMALLDDWYWRVLDDRGSGPRLEYAPWGTRVWDVTLGRTARAELTPLELFNRVTVHWERESGAHRQTTAVADPDPLPGITNTWEEELSDVQPDNTLAVAVANNLIGRVSRPSYQGRVHVVEVFGGTVYDILPGDHVRVRDWGPAEAMELPVTDVEYRPTGVTLGIEMEATADRFIALAGLRGRTRGRRKKRRRKRR